MGTPGTIQDIRPFAELSRNATTSVYKAYQSSLERFVLLKRLRPEFNSDGDLAARFQEEARIAARIQHPNVVSIYSFGRDDEGAYIVAEFVDGVDLEKVVAKAALPPDLALFVLLESAKGLKAAHDKDVLHRDLKPANVMVSRSGDVKIADFGLASVSHTDGEDAREIRGTLAYMAPEQVTENQLSAQTDLFSLGATCFEIITGRRAFPGSTSREIFDAILHRNPLPILAATRGVDAGVERICARLLAREPADRYACADELIADVESCRRERDVLLSSVDLAAFIENPESFVDKRMNGTAGRSFDPAGVLPGGVATQNGTEASGTVAEHPAATQRFADVVGDILPFESSKLVAGSVALAIVLVSIIAGLTLLRSNGTDGTTNGRGAPEAAIASLWGADGALTGSFPSLGVVDTTILTSLSVETVPRQEPSQRASPPMVGAPRTAGFLTVTVDPEAVVFVDGDSAATAGASGPTTVALEPGEREIVLRNPSFPDDRRTMSIESGDTTSLHVSLWSAVGRLSLQVSPWANVFVDGRSVGQSPFSEPLVLRPGERELRLVNPQMGVDYTTTVTIESGQTVTQRIILSDLE